MLNFNKNGIQNYISGNTLIEMGQAYVNNKKIYLLKPIPSMVYTQEIIAMQPIIIDNNLKLIEV